MEQTFSKCGLESLTVEKLGDGSLAILDVRSKSVHSLNPSAAAVWEACNGSTLGEIGTSLAKQFGGTIENDVILGALAQLQAANLIESASPVAIEAIDLGRRSLLKRAGAVGAFAIPAVLTLTAAEQKAYAFSAVSTTGPLP